MKNLIVLILTLLATVSLSAQLGKELYRPAYHYSPKFNWMNDPNGLVYYNGKYHLFYQYNPSGMQWGNMSWGHAVSVDLINWEEKPVAIPVQNGVMAFSGSVVVDWNNTSGFGINGKPPLIAIYTGATTTIQDQRIAYSNDEGLTWTAYSQNPVINSTNNQFRDPKVIWHNASQKWIMVVSTGFNNKIRFYSSTNLKNWTYLEDFGPVGNISGVWECPDLFELPVDNDTNNTKWVLLHSITAQSRAQYFIGDFDGQHFTWTSKAPNGVLIDDFEHDNYNDWIVTGTAFGAGPVMGNLTTQKTVCGFLGNRLINSFNNGNISVGKLISPDFSVKKNYIGFLIGGGDHLNGAYIKLVVNGETVRTSTGQGDDFMKWKNWDVSSFVGQTAHLEVVDSVTGLWGHILVDHIIQSDMMVDNVNNGEIDKGEDFYAGQSFSDMPDGRRIWLGWLNNWNYAANIPTAPWKGIMSIPRELKLETHNGQIKLVQKPIEELNGLRNNGLSFRNTRLSVINNSLNENVYSNLFNDLVFNRFELKARLSVLNQNGFVLKFRKKGSQYSEFIFDFINKEIRFNRSRSGRVTDDVNFRRVQVAPLPVEDDYLDIHLFVDNCSAELFAGNGQIVMSNQIFPNSTSNSIELTALNEDIIFDEFNIWKIDDTGLKPDSIPERLPLFHVYPNPVVNSNGITIKIKDKTAGPVKFNLFNMDGKLISEFQSATNSVILPINMFGVTKGLYFLSGSDGKTTQTEKLLVLNH